MSASTVVACIISFLCGSLALLFGQSYNERTSDAGDKHEPDQRKRSGVYDLQHGILNIQLPAPSMWMNMGFWREQPHPTDFPKACRALLREVLETAGVLNATTLDILDVGFGCGDQTIELLKGMPDSEVALAGEKQARSANMHVRNYVGITDSRDQFNYAYERLSTLGLLAGENKSQGIRQNVEIFCEDAARPEKWSLGLLGATSNLQESSHGQHASTWLLGLDTLYHFSPSRLALLEFACKEVGASFMAFDLLLDERDQLISIQRLILRLVCLLTATPYSNLMTRSRYRTMLIKAGYDEHQIQFRDISKDVFLPLERFLGLQHERLRTIGKGIGAFRAAKVLFGWWGTTGIVRGNIVVAKRTPVSGNSA